MTYNMNNTNWYIIHSTGKVEGSWRQKGYLRFLYLALLILESIIDCFVPVKWWTWKRGWGTFSVWGLCSSKTRCFSCPIFPHVMFSWPKTATWCSILKLWHLQILHHSCFSYCYQVTVKISCRALQCPNLLPTCFGG